MPNNSNTTSPKIIIVVGVINANIVLIATLKEEHQRSYKATLSRHRTYALCPLTNGPEAPASAS